MSVDVVSFFLLSCAKDSTEYNQEYNCRNCREKKKQFEILKRQTKWEAIDQDEMCMYVCIAITVLPHFVFIHTNEIQEQMSATKQCQWGNDAVAFDGPREKC